MKNLLTYEQFLNEEESPITNGVLKGSRPGDVVHIAGRAITVDRVIKEVNGQIIEFVGYSNDGKKLRVVYDDGRDGYVLDEFEGSMGGSTQLASDLFLATQTAANGIAF